MEQSVKFRKGEKLAAEKLNRVAKQASQQVGIRGGGVRSVLVDGEGTKVRSGGIGGNAVADLSLGYAKWNNLANTTKPQYNCIVISRIDSPIDAPTEDSESIVVFVGATVARGYQLGLLPHFFGNGLFVLFPIVPIEAELLAGGTIEVSLTGVYIG